MLVGTYRQRGVTLIELMITLVILGIVVAWALPSFSTWIANSRLRSEAEVVQNALLLARSEAVKRNLAVRVNFADANSAAWTMCFWDSVANACSATESPNPIQSRNAPDTLPYIKIGLGITSADISPGAFAAPIAGGTGVPGSITFGGLGRPIGADNITRIDVRNESLAATDERRISVAVSAGGQVRMCDPKLTVTPSVNPRACG